MHRGQGLIAQEQVEFGQLGRVERGKSLPNSVDAVARQFLRESYAVVCELAVDDAAVVGAVAAGDEPVPLNPGDEAARRGRAQVPTSASRPIGWGPSRRSRNSRRSWPIVRSLAGTRGAWLGMPRKMPSRSVATAVSWSSVGYPSARRVTPRRLAGVATAVPEGSFTRG